jgi:hypothetical protein
VPEHVDAIAEPISVEPRWPIALAISFFIALSIVLRIAQPHRESLGPDWLVPAIEVAMLLTLLAADPARIKARAKWLRRLSLALTLSLGAVAVLSTGILVADLINGGKATESAGNLLASGAVIWLGNCLVFSLIYWLLDSGGPLARYRGEHPHPDIAFTQQMSPELAPPGWRPQYADYLILGLTTNTAFSPTDVLPMAPWAKATMALQALIALMVVGLVIARAVNVLG